jgi:dihydroxy-acid dehydratase
MGTEGMKASLVSREVIADSIELVARGHMFDGIVALVACDKTIPGAAMALLRLNVPGLILYGGSIMPGKYKGHDITLQEVFEAVGANARGKISDQELLDIENAACPGAGACGGQFTANTMATVMELIGLSPMGTAAVPQVDPAKNDVAYALGPVIMDMVKQDRKPRDIATRKAFENAIAGVAATGGSTNAVLHLIAISSPAASSSPSMSTTRAASASSPSASPTAATSTARRSPAPARPSPRKPRNRRKPPDRKSSTRSTSRSSPTADSAC